MKEQELTTNKTTLAKFNQYLEDRPNLILWSGMALTAIFALLLYEPKVSIGGDDSMYINRAYNFIHNGSFPMFQGPLYPMFLGVLTGIFGIQLQLFKFVSLLCLLVSQYFMFKIFYRHTAGLALFAFFIFTGTSAAFLYYGSSTYSEVFYLFIQSIFLYYFVKHFIDQEKKLDLKRDLVKILITGLLLFLLSITKNLGLVGIIAVVLFLLLQKKWKLAISMVLAFVLMAGIFKVAKVAVWHVEETQISNQLDALLIKVPYQPDKGKEDLYGFIMRFTGNSKVYLGYHFFNIFGLADSTKMKANVATTFLVYGIFIAGFFVYFNKSKFWLFIAVLCATTFGTTFLILQTFWLQERLIIAFIPLLLIFLLQTLYYFFSGPMHKYAWVLFMVLSLVGVANLFRTLKKIPEQIQVNTHYLSGDRYYGFPDDWVYYLKMTRWAKENLPGNSFVACRKPGMAFIYSGGKEFFGIWKVTSKDPAVLYKKLKDAGVTHVIMASLRTNPDDPNPRIINTVRRYLSAINQAYPGRLKLVHQIGKDWPVYLYELH